MIAIIYARVSTEEQANRGYSLADQILQCTELARNLGVTKTIPCVDEGVSGDVLDRPGLTRARELVQTGDIAYFVCYDPDRFSRKLTHQLIVTEEIERAGCRISFVNFEWSNTPEGRLFYSLRGAIAEYEKEKIKERTARGRRQKAKQGELTHDPQLFGYRYNLDAQRLEVEPAEAAVLQMMYEMFLVEQMGYTAIARRLEQMGIPGRRGGNWTAATVKSILLNQTYTGRLYLQKYDTFNVSTNRYRAPGERVKRRLRPKSEWVPVGVPQIIDEVTHEAVRLQAKRISRTASKRDFSNDYLLSGLLRCGICGRAMSATRNRRGKQVRYYRCNSRAAKAGKCTQPYLCAEEIESRVWKTAKSWGNNLEAVKEALGQETALHNHEYQALQRHLEQALRERERLVDLVQTGLLPAKSAAERLKQLSRRIKEYEQPLSQRETRKMASSLLTVEEAFQKLMNIDTADLAAKKALLRHFIQEIIVYSPDVLLIRAKVPLNSQTARLS